MSNGEVEKIKEMLGENLVTLVDYNNGDEMRRLAVCKSLSFETLTKLKELREKPIIFSEDEVRNAIDVFPVEFLNIKRHHKLLYGSDIFINMEISKKNMRHQLEFEFRSKLIHLRQSYIHSDGDVMDEIIMEAIPALAPIIGALMYMKDVSTKYDAETFKSLYGVDTQILVDIHNIRIGKTKFDKDKNQYIIKLINVLEQIGKIVNGLEEA